MFNMKLPSFLPWLFWVTLATNLSCLMCSELYASNSHSKKGHLMLDSPPLVERALGNIIHCITLCSRTMNCKSFNFGDGMCQILGEAEVCGSSSATLIHSPTLLHYKISPRNVIPRSSLEDTLSCERDGLCDEECKISIGDSCANSICEDSFPNATCLDGICTCLGTLTHNGTVCEALEPATTTLAPSPWKECSTWKCSLMIGGTYTWEDALAACNSRKYQYIVRPYSATLQEHLQGWILETGTNPQRWLGIRWNKTISDWSFIADGSKSSWFNWNTSMGEPSQNGTDICVIINVQKWETRPCSELNGVICENDRNTP